MNMNKKSSSISPKTIQMGVQGLEQIIHDQIMVS